jgi:hypothetical protein
VLSGVSKRSVPLIGIMLFTFHQHVLDALLARTDRRSHLVVNYRRRHRRLHRGGDGGRTPVAQCDGGDDHQRSLQAARTAISTTVLPAFRGDHDRLGVAGGRGLGRS